MNGFSDEQKKYIDLAISGMEQRIIEKTEIFVQNLQLEMIRQFQFQMGDIGKLLSTNQDRISNLSTKLCQIEKSFSKNN